MRKSEGFAFAPNILGTPISRLAFPGSAACLGRRALGASSKRTEDVKPGVWDVFLLEEDLEAFAEAFGVDESF